ncbi:MopE-related protein [Flavobacteriaceae bacterium]|nr:MopE-related protein [Flavobacteriaceae bacterium]
MTGVPGNDQSLNNSSGFNAFPEGYRSNSGSFYYEGDGAIFWSSTENGTDDAWARGLDYNKQFLYRANTSKQGGFSVRFVKDGEIDPNDIDNDNDGYSENQGDCDDNNVQINPDVAEIEDGIDNNCDGEVDEGFNEELTFPVITTNELIEIFSNHAISGGNITSDGGAEVTERGVVWGTSPNPTINLETKTQNGGGTGNFSSYVYGLSLGVEYYLRAYATNSVGTAYGDEIVFETSYAIGQQGPAGGLIFYDKGFYSDGWRYLEANQTDFSFGGVVWWNGNWNYQNEIGISPNSNLGDGKANTLLIIEANNNLNNAAKVCNDFVYNGYSDWYLPSIGELELMCQNLYSEGIGNFADSFYWSSTDTNKIHNAHWIQFSSSPSNCVVRTDMGRNMENLVRPIRQF